MFWTRGTQFAAYELRLWERKDLFLSSITSLETPVWAWQEQE